MLTRRSFLTALGACLPACGAWIEPLFGLHVARYALNPPGWPEGLALRLVVLTDIHACEPWMSARRISGIVAVANALQADCAVLLGDYIGTHPFQTPTPMRDWTRALAQLRAPLGVHAVLGNHDWWSDIDALKRGDPLPMIGRAMQDAGIRVYHNESVRLSKEGRPFWLVGLGDQLALSPLHGGSRRNVGLDDLPGALAQVTDAAPAILLAHEPDIFPQTPARVALTLSGHTHGGQVNLFGWRPATPSRYGQRYAYGRINEQNRDLIVSGGLGCSLAPLRIGVAPEIVVVDLGG